MAYPIAPLINGKSYEWADIVVNVLGVPIISYTNLQPELDTLKCEHDTLKSEYENI